MIKVNKEFVLTGDMEEEIAKVQFGSILELVNTTWVLEKLLSVDWAHTTESQT